MSYLGTSLAKLFEHPEQLVRIVSRQGDVISMLSTNNSGTKVCNIIEGRAKYIVHNDKE